jgi:hypothetical protein
MEYNIKTDVGTFWIKITDDVEIDPESRTIKKIGYGIGIGGNKDLCVYITIRHDTHVGKLHNLRIRGLVCETSGIEIKREKTVHMVNLLFTILKTVAPHVKFIELEDESEFPCKDNERTYGISLALYELAFHQSTWYERHFGAELSNDTLRSLYKKDGFYGAKPEKYDFRHPVLNTQLQPVYSQTSTWKEFFKAIYNMEGGCKLILPWYKDAVRNIMGGVSFESQMWRIDLSNSKIKEIPFTTVPKKGGGGGARRRATRKNKYVLYDYLEDPVSIMYTDSDFNVKLEKIEADN